MQFNNPISEKIGKDRYFQPQDKTTEDVFKRVVDYVCQNDEEAKQDLYYVLSHPYAMFGGRVTANAGLGSKLTLNNCFTSDFIQDDMANIFEHVKIGALTHQSGGEQNCFQKGELVNTRCA